MKSLDELPADQRPTQDYLGGTFGLSKTDLSVRKILQKSQAYLERELKRFEPYSLSVYSGPPNAYTSLKPEDYIGNKESVTVVDFSSTRTESFLE